VPRPLAALVLVAALAAAVVIWWLARPHPEPRARPTPAAATLPDFGAAAGWVNGGPLTADSLRGAPVALVVWSDTDPRGLDLVREAEAWHQAYARYGARVVAVHVPEFSFAAESSVTAGVAKRLGLHVPIARDPGYLVQRRLGLDPPAVVIAGGDGRIVFASDAGGAPEAERALRDLVRALHPDRPFPAGRVGAAGGAAGGRSRPRVVYLGTARATHGPLAEATSGRAQTFTTQFRFQEEGEAWVPYPVGRWMPGAEALTAERAGAANFIALRTGAGRVFAVIGAPPGRVARVWVLDGDDWLAPGARGDAVREDSRGATFVEVDAPRLYAIARGGARMLRLSPDVAGLVFYSFAIVPE